VSANISCDSYVLNYLYGRVGATTLTNSGTEVLHIYQDGNFVQDVETTKNFVVTAGLGYSIQAGDSTVIATIDYPDETSFTVAKGSQKSGARFKLNVEMGV
jgi:uncharacterized protein (DUF488 family)